jgi:hypothetical protein
MNINLDELSEIKNKRLINSIDNVLNDIKEYAINSINIRKEIESKFIKKGEYKDLKIDRFEENLAVCEVINKGKIINIKKEYLPINSKEGDILRLKNGKYEIDFKATKEDKNYIKEIVKDLWDN